MLSTSLCNQKQIKKAKISSKKNRFKKLKTCTNWAYKASHLLLLTIIYSLQIRFLLSRRSRVHLSQYHRLVEVRCLRTIWYTCKIKIRQCSLYRPKPRSNSRPRSRSRISALGSSSEAASRMLEQEVRFRNHQIRFQTQQT